MVPYAADPEAKTTMSYLLDLFCDVPEFMEDADMLFRNVNDGEYQCRDDVRERAWRAKKLELEQKIMRELKVLYEWRASWAQQNPNSSWEEPTQRPSTIHLFPTVLHFRSLRHANEITIYNAILLLLHMLGSQVIGLGFDPAGIYLNITEAKSTEYAYLYGPRLSPNSKAIAVEICRSVEYHLSGERKSAGAFFLLCPLYIAHKTFEFDTAEAIWCREMMGQIADSAGFEIGRYLSGLDFGISIGDVKGTTGLNRETSRRIETCSKVRLSLTHTTIDW